jgi:2-amino-4-hydroxy-6-hydroxymethyldihydropteridine diphosphokinase
MVEHTVFLGLGSNIGDRAGNLKKAVKAIKEHGLKVERVSSVYESKPVDYLDQPDFYNAVMEIKTSMGPHDLLEIIQTIELDMGRKRPLLKGPRIIDIDILMFDDLTVNEGDLTIPHPYMKDRMFVMLPIVEIRKNARFPDGESIRRVLSRLKFETDNVRKIKDLDLR